MTDFSIPVNEFRSFFRKSVPFLVIFGHIRPGLRPHNPQNEASMTQPPLLFAEKPPFSSTAFYPRTEPGENFWGCFKSYGMSFSKEITEWNEKYYVACVCFWLFFKGWPRIIPYLYRPGRILCAFSPVNQRKEVAITRVPKSPHSMYRQHRRGNIINVSFL